LLPHHIHSHSAAGDVGNPRRRGETGFKYEMKGFVLRKMHRIADQSLLHGLGQDALRVQPPSVVGYLDDDVARLVTRAQANAGQGFLPAAARPSGSSTPWSRELRTMCMRGSASSSTMVRSISVSSPPISNSVGFPILRDKSRTCLATR